MDHETDMAAETAQTGTSARVSRTDGDAGRTPDPEASSGEGPRAAHSVAQSGQLLCCLPVGLRGAAAFEKVYARGARGESKLVGVRLLLEPGNGREVRVGFAISKKVGKAVVRNRVRRRLRAAIAELCRGSGVLRSMVQQESSGAVESASMVKLVVAARPQAGNATYQELRENLEEAINKAWDDWRRRQPQVQD